MSFAWFKSLPALTGPVQRGGAAVGLIRELPGLELGAILLLRQWCDGEVGRVRIAEDFSAVLGAPKAAEAVNLLAHLVTLLAQHGRRPLMRHDLHCACFGGDESAFAQMVAAAASGDRDDAMEFALTLMPPAAAYEAVQTAEGLGRAIRILVTALSANADFPLNPTHH